MKTELLMWWVFILVSATFMIVMVMDGSYWSAIVDAMCLGASTMKFIDVALDIYESEK